MKNHIRVLLVLMIFFAGTPSYGQSARGKVTLELVLTQCPATPDSVFLFAFDGLQFSRAEGAAPDSTAVFRFELPAGPPTFYYVGLAANNLKPLLLGPEPLVKVKAPCARLRNAVVASRLNTDYERLKNRMNTFSRQADQLAQQYRRQRDEASRQQVIRQMARLDSVRLAFIDSLDRTQPAFGQIARLNTYLSYFNHGKQYPHEVAYFAKAYFQLVDWTHPLLPHVYPWVHQGFSRYGETLARVGYQPDSIRNWMAATLAQVPETGGLHRYALGGLLSALMQRNHPASLYFGQLFLDRYGKDFPRAAAFVEQQMRSMASFITGAEAPDFALPTPEGDTLRLSDLRGKVVLIDFWASWCGPCRRENPNVVRLFHKYKDKGFDILGVSLDRQRDRWIKAIEADGLTWHHVSDLKGWQNAVARLYGVRSIPHTVLVDREGRIIARNLRGPTLEARLAEIFGE